MAEDRRPKPIALGELIRFLIVTLIRWAQTEGWGEIRITVREGQILTVQEMQSYQGGLPKRQSLGTGNTVDQVAEQVAQNVTAVAPPRK